MRRLVWVVVGVAFSFAFFSYTVFAKDVDQNGPRCSLTKSYPDILKELKETGEKKDVKKFLNHEQVYRFFHDNDEGFVMSYAYKLTNKYDPALILGIFTSADEHAGDKGLGGFIKQSKIVSKDKNANPYRVFYEQHVKWMDNGKYTVENKLQGFAARDAKKSYLHWSRLLSSNGAKYAPKWMSAFVRVDELNNGDVLVVACNYMKPRSDWFQDTFNSTSMKRVKASANKLNAWVDRAAQDQELGDKYRKRFHDLLGY